MPDTHVPRTNHVSQTHSY